MANYHLSMKPLSRSSGRSAVAAAAYRAGVRLELESTGEFHDFTAKRGIVSADITLPEGMKADWALDRSRLWNAAESAEVRKDARVAREFEVALPHELDKGQRHALVMEFSQMLADRYGVAVDAAIHRPDPSSDQRNHHAHILMTTRKVGPWGLGDKSDLERENAWLIAHGKATSHAQLRHIRKDWEDVANVALQHAGHNVRIDHRSYEDRGIDLVPSTHVGVFGTRLGRRGASVERVRLSKEDTRRNADLVRRKPSRILDVITSEKSVFTERDVSRALWRCAVSKADMQELLPLVMASPKVCVVQGALADSTYDRTSIKYSTQKMVALETRMADGATAMAGRTSYGVASKHVAWAIKRGSQALRLESGNSEAGRSKEQIMASRHVTNPEHISVVIGYAGSGKSTMLSAAREAWESQGYRVHGAALAGKAAKGLEDASALASRTLASWQRSWDDGYSVLRTGDVLVLDEAGMVGSVQMARLVDAVERAGAKLVLVGDSEQLQAIGAGSAFKAIQDIVGAVGLEDVRRQRSEWQRDASIAFASHRTQAALALYDEAGAIHLVSGGEEGLRDSLLAAYVAQRATAPACDVLVLAHRRRDVAALNEAIRAVSQASGWIGQENDPSQICDVSTTNGGRRFVKGDRLVFLENDREMGVKNGTLGTVVHETLDELYKPFIGKFLTTSTIVEMEKIAPTLVNKHFKIHFKNGDLTTGKNRLIFEVANRFVANFLAQEKKLLSDKKNQLKIIATEENLAAEIDIDGINFPIKLHGNVDRVDELNGEIRIIDYKSGMVKATELKVLDFEVLREKEQYKAIQVLLYAFLFTKSINFNPTKKIKGGVFSFKNLNQGFLPINFSSKPKNPDTVITQEKLDDFITELKKYIKEIYNSEISFIEPADLKY